jgi:hypothetical protein
MSGSYPHTIYFTPQLRRSYTLQVGREVPNRPLLVPWFLADNFPQTGRLDEIIIGDMGLKIGHFSHPLLMLCKHTHPISSCALHLLVESSRLKGRANVVRVAAVVVVEPHRAISLVRTVHRRLGGIGWELLVVDSEAIPGCIGVGEHPSLEHWIHS